MQFQIPIHIKPLDNPISYKDNIFFIGSCFTEHIGNYLSTVKFNTLQNPNGIVFDSLSVCSSLQSYINNKKYNETDLFELNEAWHSWQHHSRFSGMNKAEVIENINASQQQAHEFLKKADWLIISLGSSFSYQLFPESGFANNLTTMPVANCHKAPQQVFKKHLCTIEETVTAFDETIYKLFHFNNKLKIIFTVSPVRHIRDGIVENNLSKARLLESVHHLVNKFDKLYYFPAYEIVIDVLRDYRFYDIDLVHPNYSATTFVLEKFTESYIDAESAKLMEDIKKIVNAKNHKPFNPNSQQHKNFISKNADAVKTLQAQYPYLNFKNEIKYFNDEL